MHWFGLTDGLLWIKAGEKTIYELSYEAAEKWQLESPYNDYQLSRFLEDFSQIMPMTAVSVPERLYERCEYFGSEYEKWKNMHIDDPDEVFYRLYEEEFDPAWHWFGSRSFDSGHLREGPYISFIRCGDRIKLIWKSVHEKNSPEDFHIWKYPCGVYEMPYNCFVSAVREFFSRFFRSMDIQVEKACGMDWGGIMLDKIKLREENEQRRDTFRHLVKSLDSMGDMPDRSIDMTLYDKMLREIR